MLGDKTTFDFSTTLWPLVRLSPTIRLELVNFQPNVEATIKRPVLADKELIESALPKKKDQRLRRSPKMLQKYIDDIASYFPDDLLADLRAANENARKLYDAMWSLGVHQDHLLQGDVRDMKDHAAYLWTELRSTGPVDQTKEIQLKLQLVLFRETLSKGVMGRLDRALIARIAAMEEERKALMEL